MVKAAMRNNTPSSGFTLIELSIVLVIIGLIVGGVLVGQDLITAARIRAQISQIEKYNTAVNTFRVKYNAIPGDMTPDQAAAYGFIARTGALGDGDGDGYVYGLPPVAHPDQGIYTLGGETVLFWTDLSAAGLVDGGFNDNSDTWVNTNTDAGYAAEMPRAKIGNGNYICVNGHYGDSNGNPATGNGFQIIKLMSIGPPNPAGFIAINAGLTALESFSIDQKIDDGLPISGRVVAMYPDSTNPSNNGEEIVNTIGSLCVLLGPPVVYNIGTPGVSNVANCSLRFNATW